MARATMDFAFVHAADLHLDSPLRTLGRSRVEGRDALWEVFQRATFEALENIVALCLREQVDFLLLAGDLFDAKDRSVRARLALHAAVSRLDAAGVRTFLVHGNHDPLDTSSGLSLPATAKVFGYEWEEVPVVRDGRLLCTIQGISYPTERVTENLARRFRRTSDAFAIGLLHANVGAQSGHADYAPCSVSDLAATRLDYWALGHVHQHRRLPLETGGQAVYPGNSQGRHARELGEKGCCLVKVTGGHAQVSFVPTDVVRWHQVEVSIDGLGQVEDLMALAADHARRICTAGFRAHAVRLVLRGQGRLHHTLSSTEALAAVEDRLGGILMEGEPPVLLDAVVDETTPSLDLAAIEASDDLRAHLWRRAKEMAADDARVGDLCREELGILEERLRRLGIALPREQVGELFQKATLRALELLSEEAGP